jgi:phosphoribosyl-ATP pyrophosphohydrolase
MTSIKEFQNHINEFDKKREWDGFYPYDILLNINDAKPQNVMRQLKRRHQTRKIILTTTRL